jgi:hypothetical protein
VDGNGTVTLDGATLTANGAEITSASQLSTGHR